MKKPSLTFGKSVLAVSLLALVAGIFSLYVGFRLARREFPDVTRLKSMYPQVIYQGKGQPVKVRLQNTPPPAWVRLDQISKAAVGAVVVSEDWAFYQHEGFDPNQLREAIHEDLKEGKFARGGSTITMQVVKNVFLSKEKTLWRKFKEFFLAVQLDRHVSKRKILETYLNIAEWGEGTFGMGRAANLYFHKPASELSPKEGAFLAMLLPSPKRYSQSFRNEALTPYARKTVNDILDKMERARYIDEAARDAEKMKPLSFESAAKIPSSESVEPSPGPEDENPERELEIQSDSG